jgi:hypothetical protein
MTRCLTTPDLLDFLSRLDVTITPVKEGIIVHAITGQVLDSRNRDRKQRSLFFAHYGPTMYPTLYPTMDSSFFLYLLILTYT